MGSHPSSLADYIATREQTPVTLERAEQLFKIAFTAAARAGYAPAWADEAVLRASLAQYRGWRGCALPLPPGRVLFITHARRLYLSRSLLSAARSGSPLPFLMAARGILQMLRSQRIRAMTSLRAGLGLPPDPRGFAFARLGGGLVWHGLAPRPSHRFALRISLKLLWQRVRSWNEAARHASLDL